jgi:Ser/Thr protein kinase RdoA (MazF antagonist)
VTPPEPGPEILAQYGLESADVTAAPGGHINLSWIVAPGRFLLQRINPAVFPDGTLVLENVAAVCDHLAQAVRRLGLAEPERGVLRLVRTRDGRAGVRDVAGVCWRLLHYIEGAQSFERVESPAVAHQAGAAFGLFQRLLADYAGPVLGETIPGFHDTRARLDRLESVVCRDPAGRAGGVPGELQFAERRAGYADVLPALSASGALPRRVVHNDAKVANVLFDRATGAALAVVDLDTVMSGTLLSDVGDLLRSAGTTAAEDERVLSRLVLSRPHIEHLLTGFLAEAGGNLTATERELLIFAGILLTYEQGVRFLTDYLEGDIYYRTSRPYHNLERAQAQFRLVECLEAERLTLERWVSGFSGL